MRLDTHDTGDNAATRGAEPSTKHRTAVGRAALARLAGCCSWRWRAVLAGIVAVPLASAATSALGQAPAFDAEPAAVAPFAPPPSVNVAPEMAPGGVVPAAYGNLAADEPPSVPDQMKAMQKELADLKKQLNDSSATIKKMAAKSEEFPTFRITGFTQLDGGWFSQDGKNIQQVGSAQPGVDFRRVRVGIVGKVAEFTNYMVEVDFATAGRPSFFDIWLEQQNIPLLGSVRAGQFCQPFSVDAMTGFRNLTFLERSLPFLAFVPFRRVGVMAYNGSIDQRTNWANSVFKTGGFQNAPLGDDRFATDIGQGGYSYSGRATHLLYYDDLANDRYLWHVGASFDYSYLSWNSATVQPGQTSAGSNVPFYQSKTSPEFGPLGYSDVSQNFGFANASNPVYVDSGKYQAESFDLFGIESLAQLGPWGFTGEWMGTAVNGTNAGTIFYHGGYVQAAYRLTGEHRVYDKRTASLGKIIPYTDFISLQRGSKRGIHGWGAWEVGARLSYVDIRNPSNLRYLSNSNGNGQGTLTDVTLGMTWFLNAYSKFQFNYIHAMLNNTGYAGAQQALQGWSVGELYVTRLQVDF
ncbi:MAG: hypothetical protein JSS27_06420 [Planctomycetes bacterium]|nr:hypothetical protein [Planctomycetota bacterium]